ncbi:MAG: NUDIX hydrolase [Alphaproteobacteria bacterium]|nr:NUDIX hydrolase [Alphaproteobacteria bacterium]
MFKTIKQIKPKNKPTIYTVRAILYPENKPDYIWFGQYLEGDHKKNHNGFPGGRVESDEVLIEALQREIKEETGIEKQFLTISLIRPEEQNTYQGKALCYVVALAQDIYPIDTEEMGSWKCLPIQEILDHDMLIDFCGDYLKNWLKRDDCPLFLKE